MNANVPDKLYFGERDKGILDIYSDRESNDDVEYTRTNVFIEKAAEYIKEHLFDYWSQSVTDESRFIEEFRNYMKGE